MSTGRGNALAQKKDTSIPGTFRTSRQWLCNQRVDYLQFMGSRAFGPVKGLAPRFLKNVP